MKYLLLLLLFTTAVYAQDEVIDYNWVVEGGDVTRLNQVPSNWTIGNPCGVPFYTDVYVDGDLELKGDCFIQYGTLTVYGEVIYNGFTITMKCGEDSKLIISDETLSVPSEDVDELMLFPNPTSGKFHTNLKVPYRVQVYDVNIKLVSTNNDLRQLAAGVYFVQIILEDGSSETKRIVKK